MRGVDARRTFLQYDCIFIEIALLVPGTVPVRGADTAPTLSTKTTHLHGCYYMNLLSSERGQRGLALKRGDYVDSVPRSSTRQLLTPSR